MVFNTPRGFNSFYIVLGCNFQLTIDINTRFIGSVGNEIAGHSRHIGFMISDVRRDLS